MVAGFCGVDVEVGFMMGVWDYSEGMRGCWGWTGWTGGVVRNEGRGEPACGVDETSSLIVKMRIGYWP